MMDFWQDLPIYLRILMIAAVAVGGQFAVRGLKRLSEMLLSPPHAKEVSAAEAFARRYPKVATVSTLLVSALTFVIYFVAIGLILNEFNVSLTAYFATASVLGLAIAFGSQAFVQDIVVGVTLIFSDAFDVGDMIEVSGQVGRVEKVGLRFTTLINFLGQRVYIPNRNIAVVGRFRGGFVRAYVDVQIPAGHDEQGVVQAVRSLAEGMHSQFPAILQRPPEVEGVNDARNGGWRYVRVKFRLWPGQGAVIEQTYRQRVIAAMRTLEAGYADWMVSVTYRTE